MSIIKHFRENLTLAFPIAFGQLGQVVVTFIDNIMVGRLGKVPLAAASLAGSVFYIVMVFALGLASAISPLISKANTLKTYKKGMSIFYHNLIICFFLGIIIYMLIYAFIPFMYLLGQPREVVDACIPFLEILAISLFPLIIYECFRKFSEAISFPSMGMITTWMGVLLNIVLNYFLIYGKHGFPKLGLMGGAYATLIARIFSLILLFGLLFTYKEVWHYYKEFNYRSFSKKYVKKIISIGVPMGLQMFFEVGAFASSLFIVGLLGTQYMAAHQIASNLFSCSYMLCIGFSIATTIIIGKYKALNNYKEMRKSGWSAILMTSLFMIVFGIIFTLFRNYIPFLYGNDKEVNEIASQILSIAIFFQLSDGIQVVVLGALRGMEDVKIPMKITFLAYWIVALPLSWFFSIYMKMGIMGIWTGLVLGFILASILLSIRYYKKSYAMAT